MSLVVEIALLLTGCVGVSFVLWLVGTERSWRVARTRRREDRLMWVEVNAVAGERHAVK